MMRGNPAHWSQIILPAVVPAHSASKTRVNALMLGTHIPETVIMDPRNGVPAARTSRGAPRGDDRIRIGGLRLV
jgi:hypothetical protein